MQQIIIIEIQAEICHVSSMKTNAMRILDSMNISYQALQYDIPDDLNVDIALHSAKVLNLSTEQVYKTIIMINSERQYFVFCLPAGFSISLKKAREITQSSSIDLMKTDNILSLTGYIRGGVSPIGMKRHFPTYICYLAQLEDFVYVSGGQRGISLKIRPSDLAKACQASFEDFIQ